MNKQQTKTSQLAERNSETSKSRTRKNQNSNKSQNAEYLRELAEMQNHLTNQLQTQSKQKHKMLTLEPSRLANHNLQNKTTPTQTLDNQ